MLTLVIKDCSPKTRKGNYIVSASISADNYETSTRLGFIFSSISKEDDLWRLSDGTLLISNIGFTSVCCLLICLGAYCMADYCIKVDDLDFSGTDKSIKEDLLSIAEFYYKIGGSEYV